MEIKILKRGLWWIAGIVVVVIIAVLFARLQKPQTTVPLSPSVPVPSTTTPVVSSLPAQVVEEYLDAWGRQDWTAMYAVIADGFKRIDPNAKDLESFVRFAESQDIMGVTVQEIKALADDGETARVKYEVVFFLNDGSTRPFSDSFTLRFRKNDRVPGWKLIHPFGPNVDTSEDVAVSPTTAPAPTLPAEPAQPAAQSPTSSVIPQAPPPTPVPTPPPPVVVQTPSVREITVVGDEFLFNPKNMSIKAGERVRLTFKNEGRVIHNWIIEGQGIGTQTIAGGATTTIEFTAPASGQYTVFCSVPGHRERGMMGTLAVE